MIFGFGQYLLTKLANHGSFRSLWFFVFFWAEILAFMGF